MRVYKVKNYDEMSRRAASVLGTTFKLNANGNKIC